MCWSRNVGLRQSGAEQQDAPGKLEAKLCCSRARERCVWQPRALSGHSGTTATVFSGNLHYSKINALSIFCLPTHWKCAPLRSSCRQRWPHLHPPQDTLQMKSNVFLNGAELLNPARCRCAPGLQIVMQRLAGKENNRAVGNVSLKCISFKNVRFALWLNTQI